MTIIDVKIIMVFLMIKSYINAGSLQNMIIQNSINIHQYTMKLLTSCFVDRMSALIITPELSDVIQRFPLEKHQPLSMIIIDKNNTLKNVFPYYYKFPMFVIDCDSINTLESLLVSEKSSTWWSIDSLFFIVGKSLKGCKDAGDILKITWEMNLLSSLFLCTDEGERVMIYSYNPYTNRAPYPWTQVDYFYKINNRWTLYAQEYFEDENNCASLNYDKTKFMDGYKIKAVANAKPNIKWLKNKNYNIKTLIEKNPSTEDAFFSNNLFAVLNITAIINYDNTGYFENKTAVGYLKSLVEGTHDISLSYRTPIPELKATYPLIQTSMRILTQQRKFLLPEEKILAFYSSDIFYLTAIVLLITLIVMMMTYKKEKFTSGAFDILRLLLSTTINMPFEKISIRIYFIGVFQLIIILNASFQGKLSAFLTKSEQHNVNCIHDLVLYNYDIYAPIVQKDLLGSIETKFVKGINYVPGLDCSHYIVNDPSAACIEMTHRTVESAEKYGFHISHSKVVEEYVSYWCRVDWPLIEKINYHLFRMVEAGLYEYWRNHKLLIPLKNLRNKEAKQIATNSRPIRFNDLKFAFQLLAIGIGISSLVFIIEILTWNKFLRFATNIKYLSALFGNLNLTKFRR